MTKFWLKVRNWFVRLCCGEDNLAYCEACGREVPIEGAHYSEDCWFCDRCWSEIMAEIASCDHELEPHTDEYGDDCQFCPKCSGLFRGEGVDTPPPAATSGTTSGDILNETISLAIQTA